MKSEEFTNKSRQWHEPIYRTNFNFNFNLILMIYDQYKHSNYNFFEIF